VALRDLLKDRDIISDNITGEERTFAKNVVALRVRLFIDANPSFRSHDGLMGRRSCGSAAERPPAA
jgi:hypothetical protein